MWDLRVLIWLKRFQWSIHKYIPDCALPQIRKVKIVNNVEDESFCFDGKADTWCASGKKRTPWIGFDISGFIEPKTIRAQLQGNGNVPNCFLEVRLSDTRPQSVKEIFTGGVLVANFTTPLDNDDWREIDISGRQKRKFVIFQKNFALQDMAARLYVREFRVEWLRNFKSL